MTVTYNAASDLSGSDVTGADSHSVNLFQPNVDIAKTCDSLTKVGDPYTRSIREVVRRVHNDYTEWSAPQRVRDILPNEADDLLSRRFAIVQVWRPIREVLENPLAIADSRSLHEGDLVTVERRYPDRVGQTYRLKHNPAHRWFYFPRMQPEEAIVFTVYDSARDGRARFTPHTAFKDPTAPPR